MKTGLIEKKFNFSSLIKPIINNQYAFLITTNDLLIAIDLKNNKIIYSYNINEKISEFLNLKKRNVPFFVFRLIDNEIKVFLKKFICFEF